LQLQAVTAEQEHQVLILDQLFSMQVAVAEQQKIHQQQQVSVAQVVVVRVVMVITSFYLMLVQQTQVVVVEVLGSELTLVLEDLES
jgi:hypothetical protein